MFLTIEEAATKRCVRDMRDTCLSTGCMAWRWALDAPGVSKIDAIRKYRNETGALLKDAKDHVEANPHLYDPGDARKGYCGLAGLP
jgi:ribosomal protein L7/L12